MNILYLLIHPPIGGFWIISTFWLLWPFFPPLLGSYNYPFFPSWQSIWFLHIPFFSSAHSENFLEKCPVENNEDIFPAIARKQGHTWRAGTRIWEKRMLFVWGGVGFYKRKGKEFCHLGSSVILDNILDLSELWIFSTVKCRNNIHLIGLLQGLNAQKGLVNKMKFLHVCLCSYIMCVFYKYRPKACHDIT